MYLDNGTFVDVVRIEGTRVYKDIMRSLDIRDPMVNNYAQSPTTHLDHVLGENQQYIRLPSVCSTWEEPLMDMLSVLRDSVESYLDESIFTVGTTLPFPISNRFYEWLYSISFSISFEVLYRLPAGGLVSEKQDIPNFRERPMLIQNQHDDYLVLTIDYAQAALTAMMLGGMCGGYHVERALHEPQFGSESMARDTKNVRVGLKHALQQFTVLPVKCCECDIRFNSIDEVVLFGDAVDDPQLREVLREVLNPKLYDEIFDTGSNGPKKLQSAFDAARHAAHNCWCIRRQVIRAMSGIYD